MTSEFNATANTESTEVLTCAWCGAIVEGDPIEVDGKVFDDEQCAEAMGYRKCEGCGEWFASSDSDTLYIGGEWYCSEDCAHDDGWEQCERCGEWVCREDAIWVNDEYVFCSSNCAERDGWFVCDRCGEWEHDDDGGWVHVSYCEEEHWCESCYDTESSWCRCGDYRWADSELDYDGRCPDCRRDGSEYLHEYGYCPGIRKFGDARDTPHLGTELETDAGYDADRCGYCDELHEIDGFPEHFWMTEDGSLDNGVEITSQPMTLAYHVGMLQAYRAISRTATEYGYTSHDRGTCGLHVHVGRDFFGKSEAVQDAGGYKMMRMLQRFERQFHIFSRRTSTRWCSYETSEDYAPKKVEVRISEHIGERSMLSKAKSMKRERAHSQALNFQHPSTFEFRIFRGTLKWETYFACLGLVNGMCHTAKRHGSIWVEDVDWYTLVSEIVANCDEPYARECLESYLEEKGLL